MKKKIRLLEQEIRRILQENYPVKYIHKRDYERYNLGEFPNFSASGNVSGMKKQYYGKDAKLVKCGSYIYNVSSEPEIYDAASHRPVK